MRVTAPSGPVAFAPDGKTLYVFSDRDVAPTLGRLERSYTVNRMTRPHAITLRADLPSPFPLHPSPFLLT